MAGKLSKILAFLMRDDPLVQDASYRADASDRQYIDNQIIGTQQHVVDNLISGVHGTWFQADAGLSASLQPGDVVGASGSGGLNVTLFTSTSVPAIAGAKPLGVVMQIASPGARVRVATGGLIDKSITGLATTAGLARVSTAGRVERVDALADGDVGLGSVDAAGVLSFATAQTFSSAAAPNGVHLPVKAAATGNITLSGAQTLDIVACSPGDRVLLPFQTDETQNGLYVVASGAWSRAADANTNALVVGTVVVQQGTQRGTWALVTTGTITLGSTPLDYAKLDGQVLLTLFGAVGDNSTDCTAAIVAADIAAAATNYPIFAPPGIYLNAGYAPSAAGIQWQGAGRLVTSLKLSASATQAVNVAHDDVTFDDIAIDGGGHATGEVIATSGKRTTFARSAILSTGSTSPVLLAVAAGAGFRIDDIDLESVSVGAIQITDYADLSWVRGAFNKSACAAPLLKFVAGTTAAHDFVLVEDSKWNNSSGDSMVLTCQQPVRVETSSFNADAQVNPTATYGVERIIANENSFTNSGAVGFYDSGTPGTLSTYSGLYESTEYKAP